ncbi:MAG TPA: glycoside hydrolase family 30 beta sandwich domain-containing protein [Asticcacaulis sp.]|nr:glycoside hydrolase family 30 beta sandwich domain-containing protein [Asticcacaulis sp.]
MRLIPALLAGTALIALHMSAPAYAAAPSGSGRVQVWETDADQSKLLAQQPDLSFGHAEAAVVITVDPSRTYQSMVGFGAAMTDASAYILRHDMTPGQRDALMRDLFDSSGDHLGLSFMRLTIGASDFSRVDYSYDDMPKGEQDPALAHFSLDPAKADVLPSVKQALLINPKLTLMASPWSAPGWMKTSDSLITGSLKPEAYPYFADYLARYVTVMKAEGAPILLITLQNEPGFEPADYPGMRVDPQARADFIGGYLGPTFKADGIETKILDYDHNWDLPSSPLTVLGDARANPYVAGVAWHCYAGDVGAQGPVHDAYPDKDAYFTECSGGDWAPKFDESFDWFMKTLIIGSTRNWARGVLFWNLALDENHGPHLGGCGDCRGVVTVDSRTGAVTRNLEYYALAHASRFVRPGATRIASESGAGGISTVAFRNTDGSVALIALNTNKTPTAFAVRRGAQSFAYTLPAGAAASFVWRPAN